MTLGVISTIAVNEVRVRASQPLTPESELVALDELEKSDQTDRPDCAQLKRLALSAEVNVLAMQMSKRRQSSVFEDNLAALKESVNQLRAFSFRNQQVEQLRLDYAVLLQQVLIAVGQKRSPEREVQSIAKFNRDKILFNSCKVS